MAKEIKLQHKNKTYTLTFTRKSVEALEQSGFDLRQVETQPITSFSLLFKGAFFARHANLSEVVKDEILDTVDNRQELFTALVELYSDPIEAMFDSKINEGKQSWTKSW